MSKRLLPFVLSVTLILTMCTFARLSVHADDANVTDPDRPVDTLPENIHRSWEFKDSADIEYFPTSKNGMYSTELVNNEYMKLTLGDPYKNANGNWTGYYCDTDLTDSPIDADRVNRLQVRMKVVNETFEYLDPSFCFYFAGTRDNGSNFNMSYSNSILTNDWYDMYTDDEGNYCTDWFILDIDMSCVYNWVQAKDITKFRMNFMNNCGGVVLIDYIRFIEFEIPYITKATFNAYGNTININENTYVPTQCNNICLQLSSPISNIYYGDIILIGDASEQAINTFRLNETGDVITIEFNNTLVDLTEYTLSISPYVVGQMKAYEPIVFNFFTHLSYVKTIVENLPSGSVVHTEILSNMPDDSNIILAVYDNDKLVEVKAKPCTKPNDSFEIGYKFNSYAVYLWSLNHKPVLKSTGILKVGE